MSIFIRSTLVSDVKLFSNFEMKSYKTVKKKKKNGWVLQFLNFLTFSLKVLKSYVVSHFKSHLFSTYNFICYF